MNFLMRCLKHVFRFGGGTNVGVAAVKGLNVGVAVVKGLNVGVTVGKGLNVEVAAVGKVLTIVVAGGGRLNVVGGLVGSNGVGVGNGGVKGVRNKPVSSCSILARRSCLVSNLSRTCLSELRSTCGLRAVAKQHTTSKTSGTNHFMTRVRDTNK